MPRSVDFIFVGASHDQQLARLEQGYHQKIQHFITSQIVLCKDSREKSLVTKKQKESRELIKHLGPQDFVVVCDETGKAFGSQAFASKLESWQVASARVVFVIGGAYGLDKEIIKRGNQVLRLSDFTFPHELARVVLLEQVYRAFTISGGQKYHH